MWKSSAATFSAMAIGRCALAALALLLGSTSAKLHTGAFAQHGWLSDSEPPPSATQPLTVTLALRVRDREALHARLRAVSDPASSAYGAYPSAEQFDALAAPSRDDERAVRRWLLSNGNASTTRAVFNRDRSLVRLKTTVRESEALFGTSLRWHAHTTGADGGVRHLRAVAPLSAVESDDALAAALEFVSLNTPVFRRVRQA